MTQNQETQLSELSAATLEAVVVGGDLLRLSAAQRLEYYRARCGIAGLDPAAQPFQYLSLNGKLVLYATKACTDQLSRVHGIKLEIVDQRTENDLRVVTVRALSKDGRATDEIGAVNIKGLAGDPLCNAMMKAVTKAKRRAVLSMCGLGMLDETETETVPGARPVLVDKETGEIQPGATRTVEALKASLAPVGPSYPTEAAQDEQPWPQTEEAPKVVQGVKISLKESWDAWAQKPLTAADRIADKSPLMGRVPDEIIAVPQAAEIAELRRLVKTGREAANPHPTLQKCALILEAIDPEPREAQL